MCDDIFIVFSRISSHKKKNIKQVKMLILQGF